MDSGKTLHRKGREGRTIGDRPAMPRMRLSRMRTARTVLPRCALALLPVAPAADRRFARIVLLAAALAAATASAQEFPSRPVRIVDGFQAGGGTDAIARVLAVKLYERWNQPVIVDNRPGATGNLGAELVAKSTPDGHTLFMALTSTVAPSRSLYAKLGYDLLKDLVPVAAAASGVFVLLVHPSLPVNSVQELVALAKAKPRQLNYASGGIGSPLHLSGELLKLRAGIDIVHVAYKGGAPAAAAVVGGESQLGFSSLAAALPLMRAEKARVIAVTTPKRSPALPAVPTIAESGYPGFDVSAWYGLLAPAKTPDAAIRKLSADVERVLKLPDVVERLGNLGLETGYGSPEAFGQRVRDEVALWERVIREAGIKPQ